MKKSPVPQHILDRYIEIMDRHPVLEKKGKANPFTSHNTWMTSFITKEFGLALRLSKVQMEAFIEQYNSSPVIEYGTVMKDFVAVPEEVFMDDELVDYYVNMSFEHADSLPAKKKKK